MSDSRGGIIVGSKHTLLLVEDNLDDEILSRRAISTSSVACDISVIRDGGEALRQLLASDGPTPDLIVLDFHLPGANGLEVLRELRKNERTRFIPIVMLSSLESDEDFLKCLEIGANSCVRKPVDPREYIDQVALVVRYWTTVNRRPEGQPPKSESALSIP